MAPLVVVAVALLAPLLLLALAAAVSAVLPSTRPPLRVRAPRELTPPSGEDPASTVLLDEVGRHAPEWAGALRS